MVYRGDGGAYPNTSLATLRTDEFAGRKQKERVVRHEKSLPLRVSQLRFLKVMNSVTLRNEIFGFMNRVSR
jgi:hypothetical protein